MHRITFQSIPILALAAMSHATPMGLIQLHVCCHSLIPYNSFAVPVELTALLSVHVQHPRLHLEELLHRQGHHSEHSEHQQSWPRLRQRVRWLLVQPRCQLSMRTGCLLQELRLPILRLALPCVDWQVGMCLVFACWIARKRSMAIYRGKTSLQDLKTVRIHVTVPVLLLFRCSLSEVDVQSCSSVVTCLSPRRCFPRPSRQSLPFCGIAASMLQSGSFPLCCYAVYTIAVANL